MRLLGGGGRGGRGGIFIFEAGSGWLGLIWVGRGLCLLSARVVLVRDWLWPGFRRLGPCTGFGLAWY
jgi:hypothetical protein